MKNTKIILAGSIIVLLILGWFLPLGSYTTTRVNKNYDGPSSIKIYSKASSFTREEVFLFGPIYRWRLLVETTQVFLARSAALVSSIVRFLLQTTTRG